jgi:hypothetical protein
MITSIHARPQGRAIVRPMKGSIMVVCPSCSLSLGVVAASHQMQPLLNAHRCITRLRDRSMPSAAVPFS